MDNSSDGDWNFTLFFCFYRSAKVDSNILPKKSRNTKLCSAGQLVNMLDWELKVNKNELYRLYSFTFVEIGFQIFTNFYLFKLLAFIG